MVELMLRVRTMGAVRDTLRFVGYRWAAQGCTHKVREPRNPHSTRARTRVDPGAYPGLRVKEQWAEESDLEPEAAWAGGLNRGCCRSPELISSRGGRGGGEAPARERPLLVPRFGRRTPETQVSLVLTHRREWRKTVTL